MRGSAGRAWGAPNRAGLGVERRAVGVRRRDLTRRLVRQGRALRCHPRQRRRRAARGMRRRIGALRTTRRAVAIRPVVAIAAIALALVRAGDIGEDGGHMRGLHGREHEHEPKQGREHDEPSATAARGGLHASGPCMAGGSMVAPAPEPGAPQCPRAEPSTLKWPTSTTSRSSRRRMVTRCSWASRVAKPVTN
jgi:hypothetical protein